MAVIKCPAGEFPMPEEFTFREMRDIKRMTGLLPGQIEEAMGQGDLDVVVALVVVSANRAGKDLSEETVLDWDTDAIEWLDDPKPAKKVADPTKA